MNSNERECPLAFRAAVASLAVLGVCMSDAFGIAMLVFWGALGLTILCLRALAGIIAILRGE